jgi:hypothetical protein
MATTGSTDGVGDAQRGLDKPPSYFISSIIVLFLCLPFGLIALLYGLTVQTKWRSGDERGAIHSSDMAEKWMYGGVGAFILIFIASAAYWFFIGRHSGENLDV